MFVATPENMELAKSLAEKTGMEIAELETKRFPDGDFYARKITEDLGQKTYIVHTLYPEQDRKIYELCYIAKVCASNEYITDITAIIPYLPSRQDRAFKEGEISAVSMLFHLFHSVGIEKIITVDPHFRREEGKHKLGKMEYVVVSAADELYDYVMNNFDMGRSALVLSPDEGNRTVVESFGGEALVKVRVSDEEVVYEDEDEEVEDEAYNYTPHGNPDRNVVLLDDMFTTCGTAIAAIENLRKQGIKKKIIAAATHGLFVKDGYERLKAVADDMVTTNTIPGNPAAKVDIAELILEGMKEL